MQRTRVAVLGAGGYAGALLCRLLLRHGGVELCLLGSDRLRGEAGGAAAAAASTLGEPLLAGVALCGEEDAPGRCRELGVEVALLATPVEASLHLAPLLLRGGARVLDLSGAFRLADPALFQRTYGVAHGAEALALLREARYALPEVTGTEGLAGARLVSNPGCYVTAALVALSPLARRGLLRPGAPIFIDGKSGASGAGRKAAVELSLVELAGELRAYRIGDHQHAPEIGGVLDRLAGAPLPLSFVPHIVGTPRGLLTTCHGQLADGVEEQDLQAAYLHDYASWGRVRVAPPAAVTLRRPVGTPDAWVGARALGGGLFCALGSLDNLMKGAASQAVQNLNAMLGLPDGTGLDTTWSAAS